MQYNQEAIREAMRLANTPAGKQLISMLQSRNTGQLQQAAESASAGNYDHAKQALAEFMRNPEIRALLEQLGGSHGSDGR